MTILEATGPAAPGRSRALLTLEVACTPDSDDVFNFCGWEQEHVRLPGCAARFTREHISVLNHAAAAGLYDVVNISSVMFPSLADRYWILASGSSVGRGYGPVLVSERFSSVEELAGRTVAVADVSTTGGALAMAYCPGAAFVTRPYHLIADAVLSGECDAGVMIHEELVHYPSKGLRRVLDLGAAWTDETGRPLPVGLNIVKRSLGRDLATAIAKACRESIEWSLVHPDEAMRHAGAFGRGCADEFVPMFSNEDTRCLPTDVREAIGVLFDRVADLGLGPRMHSWEIIDG